MSALPLLFQSAGRRVGERWLWRGVDLEISAGTRWAIVGPSGSGKTVLLRVLCGLDALDEGTLRAGGCPVSDLALPEHRGRVHYLLQRPALFAGTVEENLRAPFALGLHRSRSYDATAARRALDTLGRPASFLDQTSERLSGGEQQIVALLRAFQAAPEVLLLDEPTASLDAAATDAVEVLVARWLDEDSARAAVWTSHDRAQIARVTDRMLDLAEFVPERSTEAAA